MYIRGKSRILFVALSFVGLVLVMQPQAQAQTAQVTVTYEGPATGVQYAGGYMSPYLVSLSDPDDPSDFALAMSCDDIGTDIYPGNSWQANTYSSSQIGSGGPQMFYAGTEQATLFAYDTAGLLADALGTAYYTPGNEGWGTDQWAEYSFAIWAIFDPVDADSYLAGQVDSSGNSMLSDVNALISQYEGDVQQGDIVAFSLITPCVVGAGSCTTSPVAIGSGDEADVLAAEAGQEFIQIPFGTAPFFAPVPEASALAFLSFDLLALFGGVSLVRRRMLRKAGVSS